MSKITSFPNVKLAGTGHYFPGEPITNAYFEQLGHLGIDDTWIREHTGIQSRHWPQHEDERAVEMGAQAAKLALKEAGLDASDIDLVIGTTSTTRPRTNPSSATNRYMDISLPLQAQVGLANAACFDVTSVACAGFLFSSVVATSLMPTIGVRNVLVVCAENPKPILNFQYRNSVLFGAGAGAAVWVHNDSEPGLLDAVLKSDGRYFDAFDIDDNDKMIMKGRQVGALGPAMLVGAARELMERNGLAVGDIDWYIPHQGNVNMIDEVCAELRLPAERTLVNITHRGNTSSASIPSCLSENVASGKVKSGDLVLAIGIGRGFSWGAMLFRYQ